MKNGRQFMNRETYNIRNARTEEFTEIGQLLVTVYSQLNGFPKPHEQPNYYDMLKNIGIQTTKPNTALLVAVSNTGQICGTVVYFSDMKQYGSGGTATLETNASGFRLLAVDPKFRGQGIGKLLSEKCINLAKDSGKSQLIIHSTKSMQVAWKMYEKLGFKPSVDLDFSQGDLLVFGFRLRF